MSGSRVGSGSQKSRSSQKDSSKGTAPTQKTRDKAVVIVIAGDDGREMRFEEWEARWRLGGLSRIKSFDVGDRERQRDEIGKTARDQEREVGK